MNVQNQIFLQSIKGEGGRKNLLEMFPLKPLFVIFFLILIAKLAITALLYITGNDFFGGGNDSRYYDAYATGATDIRMHFWPVILRSLNDIGLYSRQGISSILKILGFLFIPILAGKLSEVNNSYLRRKAFWAAAVLVAMYPTIFYYTTDIYRDVFMCVNFLIGLMMLKHIGLHRSGLHKMLAFLGAALVGFLLYKERGYLGAAFFCALGVGPIYSFRRWPFWLSMFVIVVGLTALFSLGLLSPIIQYRDLFFEHYTEAGSNLGIRFDSIADFIPSLLKSFTIQIGGFYFGGFVSIFVFFLESAPFLFCLVYVIKNRKYSNKFVDRLVVFFVAYSTVWLIGNDNFGTAVRLRIFNYLVMYISMFIICQRKSNSLQIASNRVINESPVKKHVLLAAETN